MDAIDSKAVGILGERGRISWAELGSELGLSPPAAAERVRKLEEAGVVRGYAARLEPAALGLSLAAFVGVTLEHPRHRRAFLDFVANESRILECHHVAGESDYLLKIRCRDTGALERLISDRIKAVAGVSATRTTIVLSTGKETLALPTPDEVDADAGDAKRHRDENKGRKPRRRSKRK